MAREDLRAAIRDQINKGLSDGAKLLYQREIQQKTGFFQAPSVIGVTPKNYLANVEVFGPAFVVMKSENDQDAVEIANQSQYGLSSAIISREAERAEKVGLQLESGSFFVNELVKSDSRVPSGGVKYSGYGRECGPLGLREFCNVQSFWINNRK